MILFVGMSAILAAGLSVLPLEEIERLETPSAEKQQIYLVRHGQSQFNLPNAHGLYLTSGKGESIPLTDQGKKQAEDLALQLLQKIPKDQPLVICSSTARRARETADVLFETLNQYFPSERGSCYEGLLELGEGKWEGLPQDELYVQERRKWEILSPAEKFVIPFIETGESYEELVSRALPDLQDLLDQYPGKLVFVVSHFVAMNALTMHWNGVSALSARPEDHFPLIPLSNCDLLHIEIPKGETISQAKVKLHIKP